MPNTQRMSPPIRDWSTEISAPQPAVPAVSENPAAFRYPAAAMPADTPPAFQFPSETAGAPSGVSGAPALPDRKSVV